ncbi:CNNM domain-containing protein [Muricauda sp. SCSIO 64092]|uniref:CNNM domain-containing protein n=1 Tax=Allomuricauda sp. SCSIO 64092 TaxID=2908842 RepID=UPI001FF1A9F2|nr:CNNM domain-containing protein [Muricauda sp. SCSIO 64092]UOY08708.1 CNNM domain-containing protein [Muricauda sp. SCSIO 64092]
MGLLIFYAVISIFFSFLCSILEAVLLSITPTFINVKKQEGKAYALELEHLKKDVDKPLIAILTLNTIAHTVGAILVGVQAKVAYTDLYGSTTHSIFGIEFTEEVMVGVVSTVMTILILVASEIIPKTIGATYWKQLANFTAKALKAMVFIMKWTGLLWLLQLFTKLIGKKGSHGSVLSREDFTAMTDIAEEEGVFEESESKVIRNLLTFDEIEAKDIMTPRTVMKSASEETTIQEFFEANRPLRFSRIPVFTERADNITGFILKDEMLEAIINKEGKNPLSTIRREILVTSRNKPIPQLLEKFVEKNEHISLVVDEYGSVSGLVTMEDVIETLLGLEIMDESDNVEDLQVLARKNWEARAKRLGIIPEEIPDED